MNQIRRALLLTTSEKYICLAISFLMLAIVSRLLTPGELGISILGTAIVSLACALREFVTPAYLIQLRTLGEQDVRTSITLQFLVSTAIGLSLALASDRIAAKFGEPRLAQYFRIAALAIVVECVQIHISALLRRSMAFNWLALVGITNALVASMATILLVWLGFSYMSFAWAWLISASVTAIVSLIILGDGASFRPSLRQWRGAVQFGTYNGVAVVLGRLYDTLPYLVLGRILPLEAVAIYNRSLTICQIPEKALLGGVAPVIMPAFSAHIRDGGDGGKAYLRSMDYITSVQWPGLACLCLLAYPVVRIVLGEQWFATVPFVQIISIALMLSFLNDLTYPFLASVGASRDLFTRAITIWPLSAIIAISAATFGLEALAWSWFATTFVQAFVSISFARRHAEIPWIEVFLTLRRGLAVTIFSIVGPAIVVAINGAGFKLGFAATALSILLAVFGWMAGLWITQHPMLHEIKSMTWKLCSKHRQRVEPGE